MNDTAGTKWDKGCQNRFFRQHDGIVASAGILDDGDSDDDGDGD